MVSIGTDGVPLMIGAGCALRVANTVRGIHPLHLGVDVDPVLVEVRHVRVLGDGARVRLAIVPSPARELEEEVPGRARQPVPVVPCDVVRDPVTAGPDFDEVLEA